jgi:hypothetical protein
MYIIIIIIIIIIIMFIILSWVRPSPHGTAVTIGVAAGA